jgi:DNA polymerase-3 subunit delta'
MTSASVLIGHDSAQAQLLEAWVTKRMHHAWLLAGPRGIGKASLADRVARFVLAQPVDDGDALFAPPPPTSLDVRADDRAAALLAARSHPGFKRLERLTSDKGVLAASISVDQVRALIPFFGTTASDGGWRVVIVDAVEDLNRNAANALLKLLEEPPQQCLFLLVSHSLGRVLPTIRSRCRRLDLRPADEAAVLAALAAAGYPPEQAATLAHMANGAIGTALRYATLKADTLERALDALLAGQLSHPERNRLIDGLTARDQRDMLELFLARLMARLRTHLIAQAQAQPRTADSGAALEPAFALWEKAAALAGQIVPLALEPRLAVSALLDMAVDLARPSAPLE